MDTKQCRGCSEEKPLTEFYRHPRMADGRLNHCKECKKSYQNEHRQQNLEKLREYDRQRAMLPHRVAARKAYQKTDAGKAAIRRSHKNYIKKFPERHSARNILNAAVRDGKIEKPDSCSECGYKGRIHGHHHDYTRPLDVEWLCDSCHKTCHKKRHN